MYVDAYYNRDQDTIYVAERKNGIRTTKTFPAVNRVYYPHKSGQYMSIFGEKLKKFETTNSRLFKKKAYTFPEPHYERDMNVTFRCLEENYLGQESPNLNLCFFDIETNFDPEKGFADPWDPFAPITAIGFHNSSLDRLFCFALKPPTLSYDEAQAITDSLPDTLLYDDEAEMLSDFLTMIEDVDVLSGWNSTGYDIPYTVNRVKRILGEEAARRFCLWNVQPREREYLRYGKEMKTYDLTGRVHLDYLELYTKHSPQQLHSYRLDFVGEIEVGENKIPYEGTLDTLYKKDFKRFLEYNRQDVALLVKIDKKKRYIDLANQIAHTNGVPLQTTMGSVALIEQAITIQAHSMGMVVPCRKKREWKEEDDHVTADIADEEEEEEHTAAVGAYVAKPKIGIASFVGAIDINSLYPSTIRALNISTETLMAQIRLDRTYGEIENRIKSGVKKSDAWEGIFAALEYDLVKERSSEIITVDFTDGNTWTGSARDFHDWIFDPNEKFVISANGTIFRRDREGIIPSLLAKWYSERKALQAKEKHFGGMKKGIVCDTSGLVSSTGTDVKEYPVKELEARIGDKAALQEMIDEYHLVVEGQTIIPNSRAYKAFYDQEVFWNMRQQARKILLNSLYGALLNEACKFYDHRMGQSVTLTGRSIARHMNAHVNKFFTGDATHTGACIAYVDTDSTFSCARITTSIGDFTIEDLFNRGTIHWRNGEKEYSVDDRILVRTYDPKTGQAVMRPMNYVYRHKVTKKRWKITDQLGNEILVTEDHSIMIERNGTFMSVPPRDILSTDIVISLEKR